MSPVKVIKAIRIWTVTTASRSYYYYKSYRHGRKILVLGDAFIGLGSRLIPFANIYSWFGKENISLVWTMDDWMPARFEDLFEMTDAPEFEVVSRKRQKLDRLVQIPYLPEDEIPWYQFYAPPGFCAELPEGNLRFLCDQAPEWAKKIFSPFFAQLSPSGAVRKRVADCKLPDDVVCVQIRNCTAKGDASRVAAPTTFFDEMRKCGLSQKFFVSCMEPEISKMVHDEFPGQIFELPNKNYRSMVDAVADMWILGHASKTLICQRPSAFAEIACWWGGCRTHVIGIDWEYMQK